jgi:hypothetical protein
VRAESIKFTPAINMIPTAYQKAEDVRGPDADIIGAYGGTLSFQIPVRAGAGSGSPFMALAGLCGCTKYSILSMATGHITGGTSTTFTISTANATAHSITTDAIGVAIFHQPKSGAAVATKSIRFINTVSITSNRMTVTVNQAFAGTNSTGAFVLGMDTIVPKTGEPTSYLSFRNYLGQGATDKYLWTINGCACTWKLNSVDAGGIPMAALEYSADNWTDAETSATTAVKAADTFSAAKPVLGDALYLDGTQTDVKSIEFDPGMKIVPLASTYGTNGRTGWFFTETVPVVNFTPYHDISLTSAWEAGTQKTVMFESTNASTGWALYIPETQLTAYDLADDEGLARGALTLKAIDPGKNAKGQSYPLWAFAVSR